MDLDTWGGTRGTWERVENREELRANLVAETGVLFQSGVDPGLESSQIISRPLRLEDSLVAVSDLGGIWFRTLQNAATTEHLAKFWNKLCNFQDLIRMPEAAESCEWSQGHRHLRLVVLIEEGGRILLMQHPRLLPGRVDLQLQRVAD